MTLQTIFFVALAIVSYIFTKIWRHWMDNPESYEKQYETRLRRFRDGVGRNRRSKEKEEKEEKEPKE